MKKYSFLKIFVLCFFIFVLENSTKAQHDAHRGAVREIVRGEYDTAEERIEKVMQDPSAIWRSLTNAYERAGRKVESEGEEYKRFVIPENYFVMSMLASMKGDTDMALAYAQNAVKKGLPFERILAGPRDAFAALYKTQAFQEWAEKESKLLIHGPMLGNVTSGEASFWVRTAEEAEVKVLVRPKGYSSLKDNKSADRHRSDVRRVPRENGYDLYEFMSSVLTNYHTHPVVETPELIFGYNEDNTFGLVHFNTKADDPTITFEIVTIDNESVWSMDLELSQLKD